MSWLVTALRELLAWLLSTCAVLLLVPVVLFFFASFVVNRPTAERYLRGLSGAWEKGRRSG